MKFKELAIGMLILLILFILFDVFNDKKVTIVVSENGNM